MLDFILRYADISSAVSGATGSFILGLPPLLELASRRRWDRFAKLERTIESHVPDSHRSEALAAIGTMRSLHLNVRLGDHGSALVFAAFGYFFFFISFALLLLSAVAKFSAE
jgi:hypothetical protein